MMEIRSKIGDRGAGKLDRAEIGDFLSAPQGWQPISSSASRSNGQAPAGTAG